MRAVIPLVDIHCHLLAGLDDGPRTDQDALAMCRIAYDDGVRFACATAHQNEEWPQVTPERIREAVCHLADQLRQEQLPLSVVPCAEVMLHPEIEQSLVDGRLLTIGGQGKYLLIEFPHNLFVDLRPIVEHLMTRGLRPILAHPERTPELLEDAEEMVRLIEAGCLMQVSSRSVTHPAGRIDTRKLRGWFKRGLVHLLGSDGHSPRQRAPRLAGAYLQIARWVGQAPADRIGSTHGLAVVQGLDLHVPPPNPASHRWFWPFW
jgi:protein-tyrosine phosphatase